MPTPAKRDKFYQDKTKTQIRAEKERRSTDEYYRALIQAHPHNNRASGGSSSPFNKPIMGRKLT